MPEQGLPRASKTREHRDLSIKAKHNRDATTSLSRKFYVATGTRVSRVTVFRRHQGKRKADSARAVTVSLHAHHAYVPRKSAIGKLGLPEPVELRCSCERIPLYEEDTKRSNVSICPTQDETEF
ncbi:hypothetical protein TNCV_1241461 [Trichonephila clavipes]|uniref:Uncharacterized protein n=1 Tax=Trichonephila clavipes TaxID=2585209 RepID=A0A8X6WFZ1_TRICX|nr:hypothetical protein TNCV_1241461 [Trichonephila clavipes]